MPRHKPRKSAQHLRAEKLAEVSVEEIDDPSKLPELYIVVTDHWLDRVEMWDERLRKRGVALKRPFVLYQLTRKFGAEPELCLEAESLAPAPPAGVGVARGSLKKPNKEERAVLRSALNDPASMAKEILQEAQS